MFQAAAALQLDRVVWASSETTLGLLFDVPPGSRGPRRSCPGHPAFIITAADTVMNRPSADLLAEVRPGVPLTHDIGEFDTLLTIDRARQILNFTPSHSWRDHVSPQPLPPPRTRDCV